MVVLTSLWPSSDAARYACTGLHLDRADIVALLQQVGSDGAARCMAAAALRDPGIADRSGHRLLEPIGYVPPIEYEKTAVA